MADAPSRFGSHLLNLGIVVLGLALVVLAYGFATRLVRAPAPASAAAPAPSHTPDPIQVEVLNGTPVDGLAARARAFLVERDVDVQATGNAPSLEEPHSRVVSRTGDLDVARRVARTMGIDENRVSAEAQAGLLLDASVILGADFRALAPFTTPKQF